MVPRARSLSLLVLIKNLIEQAGGEGRRRIEMRDVYPVKYYKDEGFLERKIEIDEEDLDQIIEEYSAVTRILTSMKLRLSTIAP
jgi:hypothetical protein